MSRLDDVIEKIKTNYQYLAAEFGVKRIGVFGSVAKKLDNDESDIDLIVEFERPIGLKFVDLAEYLEWLFGKKVDILTEDGVNNIRVKRVLEKIKEDIIYV